MSREKLNAHKWEDLVREMHEKPVLEKAAPAPCPYCLQVPCHATCWRRRAPSAPAQPSEKDEFAKRQFGSVNEYIRRLEMENETLQRRVRVLEELVAKSHE